MNDRSSIPLYLFAKAPVPGLVKTRMRPCLTDSQSAELAKRMLLESVEKILKFWSGVLVLTVAPDDDNPVFQYLADKYKLRIEIQIAGDLGNRMIHVLQQGVRQHGYAAVMGCDVPHITGETIERIYELLIQEGNVIGPATDGGFYFLGINHLDSAIFNSVVWGADQVYETVSANFKKCGIAVSKCEELRDIDTCSDYRWLVDMDEKFSISGENARDNCFDESL